MKKVIGYDCIKICVVLNFRGFKQEMYISQREHAQIKNKQSQW